VFGIGEGELAIIVVFGFLLFGPDKLPQMGRTIGRAIRQFRETQEKMTAVVQSEIIDPVSEAASAPVKPKKAAVDDDSDADEDAVETAAPAKKETFAERRARLAAEKAASEGATEGEGAADETESAEPAKAEPADAAAAGVPFVDAVRASATDFQQVFPYLNTPLPGAKPAAVADAATAPASGASGSGW